MSDVPPLQPTPDERSRPFFDGAAAGRLMLQHCSDCETWHYPVRARCSACGGTRIEWREASGHGVLYTHGQLRRVYHPDHEDRVPICLALVDLDEGVRMNANLVQVGSRSVRAGMAVEVTFVAVGGAEGEGVPVPVFRPAER